MAFGSQQVQTLKGKAQGKFAVNQTGTPWQVRGEASGDAATGQVRWYLRSYDPANAVGGHWPAAATAGFLPPNNANHDGEGYVAFRVKVRDDAPAGRRIDCSASIVFDHNPAIVTSPAWFNWIWDGQSASQDVSTLTWDAVEGGVYGVVIWTGSPDRADADARPVAEFAGLTDHRLPLPADLSSDTTYYWQVTTEADGVTSTSPVWSFELGERLTLALTPGWNLVHLPFAPDDYSSLLLQGHPLFTLEKQVYVRPATLESGRSYWLYQRTTEARGLQVFPAGETRASAASPLTAGWNLTGPSSAEATLDDTHAVWRFQGGQWRLVEPADGQIRLTPGHGYFIYHLNQPEKGRP